MAPSTTSACQAILALILIGTVTSRDVVLIHSTDVHGWVNAHPHNSTLDADFGDFYSFVKHMKDKADAEGHDLLVLDTGDLVEGTGLSDATPIHGQNTLPVVRQIPYNALTTGNHDVGRTTTTTYFESTFIPSWKDSYISANVVWKPTGNLWANSALKETTTAGGTKVLLFGFLFNFDQAASTTIVQRVEDVVGSPDFKRAASADVDLIVVVSHIAPDMEEYTSIYKALRAAQPKIPLALMAGHAHQRVFKWFDDNAFSIMSGKYFECLGLVKFSIPDKEASGGVGGREGLSNFSYEWIDTSVSVFQNLTGKDDKTFPTPEGDKIKQDIASSVAELNLGKVYGCARQSMNIHSPLDEPDSLYGFVVDEMVPRIVFNNTLPNRQFFMCNTEALRYDIFKGKVTKNDIITTNPFKDTYAYFKGLDGALATKVIAKMNATPLKSRAALRGCVSLQEQSPRKEKLPLYVTSSGTLEAGTRYDIVMPEYDSVLFGRTLEAMGQGDKAAAYPTKYDSTSAMQAYFEELSPC